MDINRFRDRLLSLVSSEYGPKAMIEKGKNRGKVGEPIISHEGLDTVEIPSEREYKYLHEDTVKEYNERVKTERDKVDPRLWGQESNTEENSPEAHRASTKITNHFSDILENHRTDLTTLGGRAKDASGNLEQFRDRHGLERAPEYPENRKRDIIIILGLVLGIGVAMYSFLASQDESSAFVYTLGTVLLVVAINLIIGITSAEAWRARKHQFPAFRIGSVLILVVSALLAVTINLGNGHYRDALDPDYPVYGSDTTSIEVSEIVPQDEYIRITDSCPYITDVENQPSREALCLLARKYFLLNELHSAIYALLGGILFLTTAWLWWRNDDEYFLYGPKARRCRRRLSEWYRVRDKVVKLLQGQREQFIKNLEASRIDLITNRKDAIKNCHNLKDDCTKLLQEVKEDCENSIRSYRTANIEVRPLIVGHPSHWDEPWEPSWNGLDSEPLRDLCSEEEARRLAQHQDEIMDAVINAVDEKYQAYLHQISSFGP